MENTMRAITKRCFCGERSAQKFTDELKGRLAFIRHKASARKYLLCSQKTSKVFGPCGIRVGSGVRFAVCNRWQTRIPYSEGTTPKSCVVVPPWGWVPAADSPALANRSNPR